MQSHSVGYPRMGPKRELKFALESFWDGKSSAEDLQKVSADLRSSIWKQMADAGIKYIPSNTFSYYDQVLDTTALLGAVPPRYGWNGGEIGFDTYFSMARGNASVPAMEMTKWFDTNYHFIVPELGPDVNFSYASHKAVEEYKEAKALGVDTVPVLVGPVSYLLLSKPAKDVERTFSLLSLLPKILPIYKEVVSELKAAGASWIQFDEPTLVLDLESDKLQAFTGAYSELESALSGLNVLIETYFADVPAAAFKTLTSLKGVTAYGFDLVRGTKTLDLIKSEFPKGKYLFAGVVDGRNIWANDLFASLSILETLEGIVGKDKLVVSTSSSLLHTAVDLVNETKLDQEIKSWLAFAAQKIFEVNVLAKALAGVKDEDGSYFIGLYLYALRGVEQHTYKVLEKIRKGIEEFYRSRVVTIGLCHDFDAHLRCAGIKLQYIEAFAARYGCREDHLKELGHRLGERARDYYYWAPFEQIPRDLGTLMLGDGIFLLELMLRSRFPEYRKAGDDDPIFSSTRIIVEVCRDILLMENQLPLIVLENLYQECVLPHPRPEHVSLPQLVRHFFNAHLFGKNNMPPTPPDGDEFRFDHLVAWARSFYSPRPKSSRSPSASDGDTSNNVSDTYITVQLIPPSVSKLYEAGVKLEKLVSASSGLNIVFDKGRLKIPHLDYWTGTFFLNVMVFEETEDILVPSGGQYVSQFMFFMGWMIRTSKDVDIIIESEIISSMLGSNTDLVALFDRISKMGWPHYYFDLCQELNDYCTSSPRHKWKATLKRDYFDTPWKIASTIASVIFLLLTVMQTVCSFLSLKR